MTNLEKKKMEIGLNLDLDVLIALTKNPMGTAFSCQSSIQKKSVINIEKQIEGLKKWYCALLLQYQEDPDWFVIKTSHSFRAFRKISIEGLQYFKKHC